MLRVKRQVCLLSARRYTSTLKEISPVFEDKHNADRVELRWDREWSSKRLQKHKTTDQTAFRMVGEFDVSFVLDNRHAFATHSPHLTIEKLKIIILNI